MLLAVMSVEKFFALYMPLKAKSYCTVGTAKWVTSILAIIIAGFISPVFIWFKAIGTRCHVSKHWNYFVILNILFYALMPTVLMLLTNVAIIYKLMVKKYKGMSRTNASVSKYSTRGSVMVVSVSLAYIILTTAPVADSVFRLNFSTTPLHRAVFDIMQYLNHNINGILYCIFGEKFRNELRIVMLFCRKKRRSENCSTSMSSVTTTTITTNPLAVHQ